MKNPRHHLFEVYKAALLSVQGGSRTHESLNQCVLDDSVSVVAIGKAAASMMGGALSALGARLEAGLIITKSGYCEGGKDFAGGSTAKKIQCIEAGHPIPDKRSLSAGKELLSFIDRQPLSRTLVFLISGGTSSLVESLPEGVSLTDLHKLNEWMLASGLGITAMNSVRGTISCIKSGRLAKYINGRKVINLLISDVPGDAPHIIGSGLLSANPDVKKSLPEALKSALPNHKIPKWLDQLVVNTEQAPLANDACFNSIDTHVIATIMDAKRAAANAASAFDYEVILHEELIHGDAVATGKQLAHDLHNSRPALHIWGGETTVCLPENPGRGGRNQHLALAAATVLDGHKDYWLLAAGTDGSDGPTTDSGGLVDGETLARGISSGFDAEIALAEANSGEFLAATNDLICTGPTGTNVMDLVIGLKI